ncbi:quinone oxidoreductase [soil metagenome]
MHAIVVHQHGGPEVLSWEEVETPEPGRGEARVRIEAIGLNFVDVYHRTGLYPLSLPFTPGTEAAGVVDAVGPEVSTVAVGDRVAYVLKVGAYAEYTTVSAERLVKIPESIETRTAAAAMVQGMTAHFLATSTYPIRNGDAVLIHAAAGGVGLLLVQVAKRAGAQVIGTVSTEEKAQLAREAGADHVIRYTERDFEPEVQRLTGGRGVQAVYDSVGKDTFERSLKSLARRGMLVLFGQSSGPVPSLDPQRLARGGSLFLTRPSLAHYTATHEELVWRASEVLNAVRSGELKLRIEREYPLAEAAEAHRALEGRETMGKVLLIP